MSSSLSASLTPALFLLFSPYYRKQRVLEVCSRFLKAGCLKTKSEASRHESSQPSATFLPHPVVTLLIAL